MGKLDINGVYYSNIDLQEKKVNGIKPTQSFMGNIVVEKGAEDNIFIISDKSEKDLIVSLTWQLPIGISAGVLLASSGFVMLIKELKNLLLIFSFETVVIFFLCLWILIILMIYGLVRYFRNLKTTGR